MRSPKQVVQLETRREAPPEPEALYGVAMLRIALELKRPGDEALEAIVQRVTARMGLEEQAFLAYLERNGGLLRTVAQRRG